VEDAAQVRLTIGEVAARLGVPVRTVRFWTDAGLVDPPERSAGGYRLYGAAAVARLDLVRTLRGLGLGLPAVRELIAARRTVADVAAEHVRALDAEIRLLRLRRTLLQAVCRAGTTPEEMTIVSDLAALSARERQQVIDEFVDRAFAGLPEDAPGAGLAAPMRSLPAELPEDPSPEQVAAWLELARLVADDGFAARVREMALTGAGATPEDPDPGVDAGPAGAGRRRRPGQRRRGGAGGRAARRRPPRRPRPPRRAGRPARHVHRRPGRALLAAAGRPQRPAAVRAVGAGRRLVDRSAARGILRP
jgi:DNA-binding transcriptional MerR regulator